jgi:ABC-type Zn uptake system ZnuABC Zn-binding protein ZnuA
VVGLLLAATLSVAATTTDLRELVAAVGGPYVRVESLTDPRRPPHGREVSPRQLTRLQTADVVVRVGLDHEPWLPAAITASGSRARDVDCSRAVTLLGTETARLRADARAHVHALGNPHYWLDPANAAPLTERIAGELSSLLPGRRATFEQNRRRFLADVEAGMGQWSAALRPFAGQRVVVVHDTWPYFARRFGLVVAGTVEEQPSVPPSPAYLGALIQRMRQARIAVLISEPGAPVDLVQKVAERTGARVATLAPSVGADAEVSDYRALFDVNVRRLVAAFAR